MNVHRHVLALMPLFIAAAGDAGAQQPAILARRYREGDSLHYQMVATNQNRDRLLRYSARADGVVARDSLGRFVEDFVWSGLVRNDTGVALQASAANVRQRLSLAPDVMLLPDPVHTNPLLIGPVLDLFTFYVDLWLSAKVGLARPGDHVRVPGQGANSWADGASITLGEDAVDFDITLDAVDSAARLVRLTVRHVPTETSKIRLPAEWMRAPLYATPNNWVEVTRLAGGRYAAAVGRETFDVRLDVRLGDGRIVAATMDNPVDVLERTCTDAALASCSDPVRYRIVRTIALR